MDDAVSKTLKATRIFSSLDDASLQALVPLFTQVELKQNEYLFYQHDPSDSVYLLTSGKLTAELTSAQGDSRIVGHIDPGETVGEVGALSGDPRALTIKALRASTLLKLSRVDFVNLCNTHASVMFETVHPIISRSKSIIQMLSSEKTSKHIVIIPANREVPLQQFYEKLCTTAEHYSSLLTVSDFDKNLYDKHTDIGQLKEKISTLLTHKKTTLKILYLLKSPDSLLAKVALKKADLIYIVGLSGSVPSIDQVILERIHGHRLHLHNEPELILLHPENTTLPRNTLEWLMLTDFSLQHHIRITNTTDYQRLLRFVRGKAVGLVLSGGGTRGYAHLGVIKALCEEKMPIDMVGGTSVGAIVAACYSIHESYDEAYEKFHHIVQQSRHAISWRSLTWPAVSLFNAKNFTESQIDAFSELNIEDFWLPLFCISCNLTNNTEEIHTRGLAWERLRATASIPGLIPPMEINGELHVDGGLLNNLPVDVMRQFVGERGRIMAVDLNTYSADTHKYYFPPILTFTEALIAKLGINPMGYKFPRFVDTFLHGMFIGSLARSKHNSLAANYFLNLNLSKFKLLHSNDKQARRLLEIGYEEAMKKINEIKSKNNNH